ncbi:MAG: hypothetical protein QOI28_1861 [Mycobacterium sp.]|nr:hypothetical protein [Mycobacterium sp.]
MLAGNYPWTKPHGRLNELGPTIQPNRSTVLCDERIDGCWLTQVGRNAERVGTEGLQPLAPIGVHRVSTVELGPRSPTSCNSASVVCLRRRHRGARRPPPAQERSKVRRNTSAPQRDRCIDPRRTPVPSSQNEEDRRLVRSVGESGLRGSAGSGACPLSRPRSLSHRCSHGCPKNAVSCQLPGHSPDHFSNSRAPWRSITVFTTEKIAPWTAAATRISLNE